MSFLDFSLRLFGFCLMYVTKSWKHFPHTDHLDLLPRVPHSKIFVAYTSQPPNFYNFLGPIEQHKPSFTSTFHYFSNASLLFHNIFIITFMFISSIQLIISSVYTVSISLNLVFHQHFQSMIFFQTTSTGSIFFSKFHFQTTVQTNSYCWSFGLKISI